MSEQLESGDVYVSSHFRERLGDRRRCTVCGQFGPTYDYVLPYIRRGSNNIRRSDMSKQFEPKDDSRKFLAPGKMNWCRTELREGLTRSCAMANVLTSLPNKADTCTLWDSYLKSDKGFFDHEPAKIVEELESRWPHFFEEFPCGGNLTDSIKREFVGLWARTHIGLGKLKHGRMSSRRAVESDLRAVK